MTVTIETIKNELKRQKISQKEFANLIGKTERSVSRWLTGTQPIKPSQLLKIKEVLNLDAETFEPDNSFFAEINGVLVSRKKVQVSLDAKSMNEYHIVEKKFGISRNRLVEDAPRLLEAIRILALEKYKAELSQLEVLQKQLPPEWGPQSDKAKHQFNTVKTDVENENPFGESGLFLRFLERTHMSDQNLFGTLGAYRAHYKSLVQVLDPECANIVEYCLSSGLLDLSKIPWDFWAEDKKKLLFDIFIQELTKKTDELFQAADNPKVNSIPTSTCILLCCLQTLSNSRDVSKVSKDLASKSSALLNAKINKNNWHEELDFLMGYFSNDKVKPT